MKNPIQSLKTTHRLFIAPAIPSDLQVETTGSHVEITVLFTNEEGTLQALKTVTALAIGLNTRIRLAVLEVVPYALPLEEPPVSRDFLERQIRSLLAESMMDVEVDIFFCRGKRQDILNILEPKALVVIGTRKSWWPTKEARLANHLSRNGRQVILIPSDK